LTPGPDLQQQQAQSKLKSSAADDIPQTVNKNVSNTTAYIKGYTCGREVPEQKMAVQLKRGHLAVKLPQLPHNGDGNFNTSICTQLILSSTGCYSRHEPILFAIWPKQNEEEHFSKPNLKQR
jgi:hypothetical protein